MNYSKTVRKRQAKELEELSMELATLSLVELADLPADESLKSQIRETRGLKGGSRKRQVKYVAKALRQGDPEPIFTFLARKRGSKLQQDREFHQLERLREAIVDEAIEAHRRTLMEGLRFQEQDWQSNVLREAAEDWPDLDTAAVHRAATRFAVTRKPAHKREIFRQLKAARDRQQFIGKES